jgi:hypothetical protein
MHVCSCGSAGSSGRRDWLSTVQGGTQVWKFTRATLRLLSVRSSRGRPRPQLTAKCRSWCARIQCTRLRAPLLICRCSRSGLLAVFRAGSTRWSLFREAPSLWNCKFVRRRGTSRPCAAKSCSCVVRSSMAWKVGYLSSSSRWNRRTPCWTSDFWKMKWL